MPCHSIIFILQVTMSAEGLLPKGTAVVPKAGLLTEVGKEKEKEKEKDSKAAALDEDSDGSVEGFRQRCRHVLSQEVIFNLIPDSGKVVVLDSRLLVRHALNALKENDLFEAPIYDTKSGKYRGMLTVTDFLHCLLAVHDCTQVPRKVSYPHRLSDAMGFIPPPSLHSSGSCSSPTASPSISSQPFHFSPSS